MAKISKPKYEAEIIDYSIVKSMDCYEVKIKLDTSLQLAPIHIEHVIDDLEDLDKLLELMNKYSS